MSTRGNNPVYTSRFGRKIVKPSHYTPSDDGSELFSDDYPSDEHDLEYIQRTFKKTQQKAGASKPSNVETSDASFSSVTSIATTATTATTATNVPIEDALRDMSIDSGSSDHESDTDFQIMKHRDSSDYSYQPSEATSESSNDNADEPSEDE